MAVVCQSEREIANLWVISISFGGVGPKPLYDVAYSRYKYVCEGAYANSGRGSRVVHAAELDPVASIMCRAPHRKLVYGYPSTVSIAYW